MTLTPNQLAIMNDGAGLLALARAGRLTSKEAGAVLEAVPNMGDLARLALLSIRDNPARKTNGNGKR